MLTISRQSCEAESCWHKEGRGVAGMAAILNTAMVLSAGRGTRMVSPATNGLPKPLVQLQGKALIDHALDRIAAAGIARAVVNVHHMADQIERHLATRRAPRIQISDERAD